MTRRTCTSVTSLLDVLLVVLLVTLFTSSNINQSPTGQQLWTVGAATVTSSHSLPHSCAHYHQSSLAQGARTHSVSITDFGAVGDGLTLNTKAFQNAIFYLHNKYSLFSNKGGGVQLFVPAGRWLTGSFQLISHLTLWLDKDAVILGSQDSQDWPIVDPLPSYGRGRELPGKRHRSLIYGYNLTDVIITGDNGTIDGQGSVWWNWFHNNILNYTRPHLLELMHSSRVVISNLTFLNSPFWTIHPVYCSNVLVHDLTIRAPHDSPNTDGIDPDSSNDVCIQDCYISTGDDLIAIKSGWDEYGISFARPSTNISIYRLRGETQTAGLVFGSEMSGGISDVHAHDLVLYNTDSAISIKTSPGRGGFIRNVHISNLSLSGVNTALRFISHYGQHPDELYDPEAFPAIDKITIENVRGDNITVAAGLMEGIKGHDFTNICLLNFTLLHASPRWKCSYIQGYSESVFPQPCQSLSERIVPNHCADCYFVFNPSLLEILAQS